MKFLGKSNKFKDYISKTFIFYTISIVLLILFLFFISLFFNYRTTIVKSNNNSNKIIKGLLEKQYDYYKNAMEDLSKEKSILAVMEDKNYLQEANILLYEYSNKEKIKANFALLDKKGDIVASNLYNTNQKKLYSDNFLGNIISKLENQKNICYIDSNKIKFKYNQESSFLLAKAIVEDEDIKGYILFYLKDTSLKPYIHMKDIDITIITDKFDYVLLTNNDSVINNMGKLDIGKLEYKNNKAYFNSQYYYINSNKINNQGLQIITMTSTNKYRQSLKIGLLFVLGMVILVILLVTILSDRISHRSLKSLDSLIYGVKQIKEGNISYKIESKTFDEFQMIIDEFNNMTSKIEILIKDKDEIAERKRKMEIKQLENQFNPHFVYNVMEMLRYEIIFDPKLASDLIVSFANLMRYNSNYGKLEVSLKTDIDYIEAYLSLQKRRFNKRLDYSIELDKDIWDFKIPKLILQPIIENSIKHGIENTDRLKIDIYIKRDNDNIKIVVKDNGQGIGYNRLLYLRKVLDSDEAPDHIGLYNVHRIIKLLYGDSYGLSIDSKVGQGTKIFLKIPIIKDDKYD